MKPTTLSAIRISRLRTQGYVQQDAQSLTNMAFGIRFPYRLCVATIATGLFLQSIEVFIAMTIIAFFGVILPYHPFDYLYNSFLSGPMHRPKLPRRSPQLKFTCFIATIWLLTVVFLMHNVNFTAGLIMGGILGVVASLPSTVDLCIPSLLYNFIFKAKTI